MSNLLVFILCHIFEEYDNHKPILQPVHLLGVSQQSQDLQAGFQIQNMPEQKRQVLSGTQIGEPVPVELA